MLSDEVAAQAPSGRKEKNPVSTHCTVDDDIYDNGEAGLPDSDAVCASPDNFYAEVGNAAGSQFTALHTDDMYKVAEPDDAIYADATIFHHEPASPDAGADDMIYDNGEAGAFPPTTARPDAADDLIYDNGEAGAFPSTPSQVGTNAIYKVAEIADITNPGMPSDGPSEPSDAIYADAEVFHPAGGGAVGLWDLPGGRGLDVVSRKTTMVSIDDVYASVDEVTGPATLQRLPGTLTSDNLYASVDEVPVPAMNQRSPAVPTTRRPQDRGGKTKTRPPARVPPNGVHPLPTVSPSRSDQSEVIYSFEVTVPPLRSDQSEVIYSAEIGDDDGDELYATAEEFGAAPAPVAKTTSDIYAISTKNSPRPSLQQVSQQGSGDVIYSAGIDAGGSGGEDEFDNIYATAEIYTTTGKPGATATPAADAVYAVSLKRPRKP